MLDRSMYKPLADHEIRLLSLRKSPSSVLAATLKTVRLNAAPDYFCLSYTWGHQSEDIEIDIDGYEVFVRPSMVDMLGRLNQMSAEASFPDSGVNWVWIDRICINQEDITERSEQVKFMGTIYSNSVRTIIWAGPDFDKSAIAWRLIDQLYDICRKENPTAEYLADIPFHEYSDEHHADLCLPRWDDEAWESLRRLFELPWFTRTWIIQEVALSVKDPLILHGRHTYTWDKLGWAASWLRRNGYLRLNQIPDGLQNCDTISNIRRSRTRWRLDALLATTAVKFKSTNQRDKIYGLIGLAAEFQDDSQIPGALTPDYTLDVWQVYTKVIWYFLREYRTLPTFAYASGVWGDIARAQRTHQYKQMPSWVPTWSDCSVSNSQHTKGFSWLYYKSNGEPTNSGFPKHYNASKGFPVEIVETDSECELKLKGLTVGTIAKVVPYDMSSEETRKVSIIKAWTDFRCYAADISPAAYISAFVNASTAEQYRLNGRTPAHIQSSGSAYLLAILKQNNATDQINQRIMDALEATAADGDERSYLALVRNFCHNRSFIVTSDGSIGIGPFGARAGDIVSVIFGGGVPYIIRKQDDHFLMVGESYISGLMDGEALRRTEENDLAETAFRFR